MRSRARNKEPHNSPIQEVQPLNNRVTQNNQCWYIKHMGVVFVISRPVKLPHDFFYCLTPKQSISEKKNQF